MIILPTPPNGEKDIPTRWQEAIGRDSYLEWLSFRSYLRALSRIESSDHRYGIASDLMTLADVAHQRAIDMEPKRADDYQREAIETAQSEQHENYLRGVAA